MTSALAPTVPITSMAFLTPPHISQGSLGLYNILLPVLSHISGSFCFLLYFSSSGGFSVFASFGFSPFNWPFPGWNFSSVLCFPIILNTFVRIWKGQKEPCGWCSPFQSFLLSATPRWDNRRRSTEGKKTWMLAHDTSLCPWPHCTVGRLGWVCEGSLSELCTDRLYTAWEG